MSDERQEQIKNAVGGWLAPAIAEEFEGLKTKIKELEAELVQVGLHPAAPAPPTSLAGLADVPPVSLEAALQQEDPHEETADHIEITGRAEQEHR